MKRCSERLLGDYEKAKSMLESYGKAKEIYEKYLELRRKAGKPRRQLMDINEIEKNLKAMGATKSK